MSKKNRNGKPTDFQIAKIKAAGVNPAPFKTYRDAENAIKRLANKAKKANANVKKTAAKKTQTAKTARPANAKTAKKAKKPATTKAVAVRNSSSAIKAAKKNGCKTCDKKNLPTVRNASDNSVVRFGLKSMSAADAVLIRKTLENVFSETNDLIKRLLRI